MLCLMAHHAYTVFDEAEAGITRARTYAERDSAETIVLRYGLFSVDDARELAEIAYRAPTTAATKAVIVSATRLFHEAQNALLKLFEEPPADTTLILVLPSEGLLLPTLRSRVLLLPEEGSGGTRVSAPAQAFLAGSPAEREKQVAKLLDRAKSDKDEEKQAARAEAVQLVEGMIAAAQQLPPSEEVRAFQKDLHAFLPILHERSAPLKMIFEHLLIVLPRGLGRA